MSKVIGIALGVAGLGAGVFLGLWAYNKWGKSQAPGTAGGVAGPQQAQTGFGTGGGLS